MLRMLGVVEAGGLAVPSPAQRRILSALALDLGGVVSADRLADLVWGEDLPANPTASLQNHVSRLRRTLGDSGAIAAIGSGYRLDMVPDALDVAVFEDAFRQACSSPADTDLIERAIDSWRGRPYDALDDDHRAAAERARLEEMLAALHELRADAWLRAGRLSEAIVELEALRHEHRLRERSVELLMHAYVEAGRKSDALDAYQQLRTSLVEELGLEPSPALRELETAILTEERVSTPQPPPVAPVFEEDRGQAESPVASASVALPTSSLFGRDDLLERVAALIGQRRIITLVGPGGVGKTRLSLHVAQAAAGDFAGVTVVELASLRAADQLGAMVAGALGLRPRAGVTDAQRIVDALGSRRHLLVLDNCEHVIEAAAELISAIAPRAAGLTLLSTSREPLGVDGEQVVRIEPLDAAGAAVDLFVERARSAVGDDWSLDRGSRELIGQICANLDGLPLAIELAASRCGAMTLEDIAGSLGEPLALARRRTVEERHGSLRALVAWSVRDLDPELTDVFVRTSLFAGPFNAAAAAEVADMPVGVVAPALADLAERSLLALDPSAGPRSTYRFLETIRAYAHAELQERPEAEDVARRHADWVLAMVEAAEGALVEPSPDHTDVTVLSRVAELRLAHQRFSSLGDLDRAVRLAASLHFVGLFHMQPEVFDWVRDTADRFVDSNHPLLEDVLASASIGCWQSGDLLGAERYAEDARRAADRSDAPSAGRAAAEARADVVQFGGDNLGGLESFEQALTVARATGNTLRVVCNLADAAMVAGYMGRVDDARAYISEAKELLSGRGAPVLWAWVLYAEGESLAEHDPDAALAALTRALELAGSAGADFIVGVAGLTKTGLQARSGDIHDAVPGLIELIEHWRRRGAWVQQWITQRTVVEVFLAFGELDDAALLLGAVDDTTSTIEAAGPDAERLDQARARLHAELPEADAVMRTGAAMDRDDVIDLVLDRLRRVAGSENRS